MTTKNHTSTLTPRECVALCLGASLVVIATFAIAAWATISLLRVLF